MKNHSEVVVVDLPPEKNDVCGHCLYDYVFAQWSIFSQELQLESDIVFDDHDEDMESEHEDDDEDGPLAFSFLTLDKLNKQAKVSLVA